MHHQLQSKTTAQLASFVASVGPMVAVSDNPYKLLTTTAVFGSMLVMIQRVRSIMSDQNE